MTELILLPVRWWPPALLAAALLADAALSIRPITPIRDCLDSVHFPREWWWLMPVVKLLGATGLIVGIWVPGIAVAANTAVIVYFLCAATAHIRAKALGPGFWVNCLGMLAFSSAVMVLSLV